MCGRILRTHVRPQFRFVGYQEGKPRCAGTIWRPLCSKSDTLPHISAMQPAGEGPVITPVLVLQARHQQPIPPREAARPPQESIQATIAAADKL
jgi:hypothetical protein